MKTQLLGFGLGLGIAGSALGQFGQPTTGFGQQPAQFGQQVQGQAATGFGQPTTGASPFGQTSPFGPTGTTGQSAQLGSPNMANAFGSGGILGANTSSAFGGLANTALLSRSLGAAGGMGGMNAMGGMGGMGGMNGARGGQGGRGGFNTMNQNQKSNKPQVRATVKLGFELAPIPSAAGSQIINSRLSRIPSALLRGINVEMNGRTAVMRGNVATLADARVVERFLSLEPGISAVKNELTIASGEKVPVTAPKASTKTPTADQSQSASSTSQSNSGSISTVQVAPTEIVPAPQ